MVISLSFVILNIIFSMGQSCLLIISANQNKDDSLPMLLIIFFLENILVF